MENNFSELTNLDSIKEFCNSHLLDIALGNLKMENHNIKIRFIDSNTTSIATFGYTGLGRFFFVDDCMYIITKDKKYEPNHNPDILEFSEELDILRYTGAYIVRVIFAGIFTGFYDDNNQRIFTGDVVRANVLINPDIPSNGGQSRAKNINGEIVGSFCEAGIDEMSGIYSMILDNHHAPLSWATKLNIVGSLFFNLQKGETEVDIRGLCNSFAQSRTDRKELTQLIKKSPYFPPVTWQERAIELLCGDNNDKETYKEKH